MEIHNLFSDNISSGSKLIVGFLVTKETPPAAVVASQTANKTPQDTKEIAKTETVDKAEVRKDDTNQEKEELKKEQPKREEEAKKEEPMKEDSKKEEPKKEEVKPVKQEPKPQVLSQGYFKTSFDQQTRQRPTTKEQTMTSGTFKTTSGWSDAKYYLLMDGVEPGTIVRITNPTNNKMIYAKLLGEMSGLKQNQGVNIRISNAAASALDIAETDKFIVKLNY